MASPGRAGRAAPVSRRAVLGAFGRGLLGLSGAALIGCTDASEGGRAEGEAPAPTSAPTEAPAPVLEPRAAVPPTAVASARPSGPLPANPPGRVLRPLLPGTPWETPLVVTHSGASGPRALVLGGVHGNEPGGWQAAELIAEWEPRRGSLLVIPRANLLATRAFERTFPELGDLNRLYPGSDTATLPMARMAAAILGLVREFEVDLVLDLHESWGFYLERGANAGTAFIGQTVTKGEGPLPEAFVRGAVETVNTQITPREVLTFRDRLPQPPPGATPPPGVGGVQPGGRSSSSLSIGTHVPGATAILIEMGQIDQPEWRRRDLHLTLAGDILARHGLR